VNETTFLGEEHRESTWMSTLTGAVYRWDDGWQVKTEVADWHSVMLAKPGVSPLGTVYARSGEKFEEV
jgi:hypothetical protein